MPARWISYSSCLYMCYPATIRFYTLSLHDALPIFSCWSGAAVGILACSSVEAPGATVPCARNCRARRFDRGASQDSHRGARPTREDRKSVVEGKSVEPNSGRITHIET